VHDKLVNLRDREDDDTGSDGERMDFEGNELPEDVSYFNAKKSKDKGVKTAEGLKKQQKEAKFLDMRHLLGFLNQSEWVSSLNIGNIMQISPI